MITYKRLFLSIVPFLVFFAMYAPARADQPIDNTLDAGSSAAEYQQILGNGLAGTVGLSSIKAHFTVSSGFTDSAFSFEVTDGGFNACTYKSTSQVYIAGTYDQLLTFPTFQSSSGPLGCTLDPAQTYTIIITRTNAFVGTGFQLYGSATLNGYATSTYIGGSTYTSPVLNIFFTMGGTFPAGTSINTVTPLDGSTNATTTSFTFGATGFISTADYVPGATNVQISFTNNGFASSQLVGPLAALQQQPDSSGTFIFPVSAAGAFNFSTSTNIQIIGDYTLTTSITVPQYSLFGFNFFTRQLAATSTTFVVATSTAFGTLQKAVAAQYQQLIGTASSTLDTTVCNPISGNFNITACMTVIFGFPSKTDLNTAYNNFQTNVATHQPWGYFSRFFAILTYSGTSTLPGYTAYIGTAPSTTMDVITVDPGDMIIGAGALLNSVTDPQNGMTIRQIMEPFVLLMVALGVFFTILADLLGSHRHNQNQVHGRKSNRRI